MSKAIAIKVPKLKSGNDAAAAARLRELVTDADDGFRRVVKCGLYIEWIDANLPWGQFMKWLEAHCPDIPLRTIYNWRNTARNLCEWAGLEFAMMANLKVSGDRLLDCPDSDLNPEFRAAREKMNDVLSEAKSAKQLYLMLGFKQGEIAENGQLKKKAGRTKGCKGTTKEQRQAAREREERERIDEIEISSGEYRKWMEKHGDAKGVGLISAGEFKKLSETVEWFHGVLKTLKQQRGEA